MSLSSDLGKLGEKQAIEFLRNKGFAILDVNWRCRHKEIDIVAEYNNKLHIIEVKTRSSDFFQTSHDVVNITKQKHLISAAEMYVVENNLDIEVVFDIVYILKKGKASVIELITDAFSAYDF